ncbi:hypothetical protein MKW98_031734 [Papaver atlanticum]|uniref:Uncharacterized protein n=1 Tax=Papaver atlanticum TaxID=357466 RepID=A0AAD4X8G6_9MAGN|nr:hypothetical protein MKW98_031734 [Papaver atlanticum]
MASSKSTGAHILVFPYPAQGHMIPLLDLTHQLSRHHAGITITVLITPKNLHILNPLLTKNRAIKTLILPFPDHPLIPTGIENVKDLPANSFVAMMCAFHKLYDPIIQWFKSHPSPPVAIISDFFLGWTYHLACELGIPRIVFSPSGALALAVIDSLWRRLPKTDDPDLLISFPEIPNSPNYPCRHISPVYRSYIEGDPSWGIVINTFAELESSYLDYMIKKGYYDRVWAVGPGGSSLASYYRDLFSWIDTCPDNSVVVLRNEQMEGLAAGLECSGVRFLWCVKEPTSGYVGGEYGVIPHGFEDRMAGRGRVIKGWAPHADQYANATLLVDQLKVAIRVCEGYGTVPDSVELGRLVFDSMSESRTERVRAIELRKASTNVVKKGGSSFKDLDRMVRDLSGLSLN